MLSSFADMVENFLELFMDDFSVFGDSFDDCLRNLQNVLAKCEEKNQALSGRNVNLWFDLCCGVYHNPPGDAQLGTWTHLFN